MVSLSSGHRFGSVGDSSADARVGSTAADVAGHGASDFGGGGLLAALQRLQERGGAHDLAALAIASLRHVVLDPGCVHDGADPVAAIGHGFDGGDLLALSGGDRRDTGANRLAVQMHGAGAA